MKTNFYDINMMLPSQINKEIIFNEAILKLDGFANCCINGFTDHEPEDYTYGDKYIMSQGENKNNICYILAPSHQWHILKPQKGMHVFLQSAMEIYVFNGNDWLALNRLSSYIISAQGQVQLAPNTTHAALTLQEDTQVDLTQVLTSKVSIVIKQHTQKIYQLTWSDNIIWPQDYVLSTLAPEQVQVIDFYQCGAQQFLAAP